MVVKLKTTAPLDRVIKEFSIFVHGRKIYGDYILVEVSELDGMIIKEELNEYIEAGSVF